MSTPTEVIEYHFVGGLVLESDLVALYSFAYEEEAHVNVFGSITVDGILGYLDARLVVLVDLNRPASRRASSPPK